MHRPFVILALAAALLTSCARQEETAATAAQSGTHALVRLVDGSKLPGTIVASTQTDMVLAGDDGIERKIPLTQVKSVEYNSLAPAQASKQLLPTQTPAAGAPPPPPAVTTRTFELPVG